MDLGKLGLFKLMKDKMAWHGQRQQVLAQNIANADTPDFRPQDLVPFDFRKELREANRMGLASTASGHMAGTKADDGPFRDRQDKRNYEMSPDGNSVVLEEQMMKVGQNAIDHQTVNSIYRKQLGLIRMALSRGGGQ